MSLDPHHGSPADPTVFPSPRRPVARLRRGGRGLPARRGRALRARRGNVVIMVTVLLGALGLSLAAYALTERAVLRLLAGSRQVDAMGVAAQSYADLMVERLLAKAEWNLGMLSAADLTELNAGLDSLANGDLGLGAFPMTGQGGVTLRTDPARTTSSYSFTVYDSGRVVPQDVRPLLVTTDQPMNQWVTAPAWGGMRTGRLVEVQVRAQVQGRGAFTRTATAKVVIAKVHPHQWALYTSGNAEVCDAAGAQLYIGGRARADGGFISACAGSRYYTGDLWSNAWIQTDANTSRLVGIGGYNQQVPAGLRDGPTIRAADSAHIAAFRGRLTVAGGVNDYLSTQQFADASVAGTGECRDFEGACSNTSEYTPSVTLVNRSAAGASQTPTTVCGPAYATCAAIAPAVTYLPYPFLAAPPAGTAMADPSDPTRFWQGLFYDTRREAYCTATTNTAVTFKTMRCPTNHYGYTIDLSALPAIPGGLLSIRKWTAPPGAFANPDGFQEVVWLKNAATLAGPLTIHSELPVALEGDYNTVAPKPARIEAPLVIALPPTASTQLRHASVWDSASAVQVGQADLKAVRPVTIRAVLRGRYREWNSAFYGGPVQGIPMVIGDWRSQPLTVHGAVEGLGESATTLGTIEGSYRGYNAAPRATLRPSYLPLVRRVLYDTLLWTASGSPPGSWQPVGRPGGAWDRRGQARQANARGGYTIMWYSQRPLLGQPRLQ